MRLSRISACGSLATPCTTLMRSNTTRRSAPMTRSRLRRPTSKSTTATFCPVRASAAPSAAVDVVLPTPPLPDVTTITLPIGLLQRPYSFHRCDIEGFPGEPGLDRLVAQIRVKILGSPIIPVDRQKFRFEAAAEDARLSVPRRARHGAAAQGSVDVDRAASDHLGARADRAHHGHVAARKEDRLAGAHRRIHKK